MAVDSNGVTINLQDHVVISGRVISIADDDAAETVVIVATDTGTTGTNLLVAASSVLKS
jgi:hypothetical protein